MDLKNGKVVKISAGLKLQLSKMQRMLKVFMQIAVRTFAKRHLCVLLLLMIDFLNKNKILMNSMHFTDLMILYAQIENEMESVLKFIQTHQEEKIKVLSQQLILLKESLT